MRASYPIFNVWLVSTFVADADGTVRLGELNLKQLVVPETAIPADLQSLDARDGLSGGAWGGEVADELVTDGVVFRHQSVAQETRPEISGHFHPKLRLTLRGRPVSRPCFAGDAQRLILPAFGSLTGGLVAEDSAIARNFPGPYCAMLVVRGRLLSVPCRGAGDNDVTESRIAAHR